MPDTMRVDRDEHIATVTILGKTMTSAFFDEVAYQPPGIALQRAKALVKRPKQTRR